VAGSFCLILLPIFWIIKYKNYMWFLLSYFDNYWTKLKIKSAVKDPNSYK